MAAPAAPGKREEPRQPDANGNSRRPAVSFYVEECSGVGEVYRRDIFEVLKACAPKVVNCATSLAGYYETTRRADWRWPVEADDREALRLYQQALRRYEKDLGERTANAQAERVVAAYTKKVEAVTARLEGRAPVAQGAPAPASAANTKGDGQLGSTASDSSTLI